MAPWPLPATTSHRASMGPQGHREWSVQLFRLRGPGRRVHPARPLRRSRRRRAEDGGPAAGRRLPRPRFLRLRTQGRHRAGPRPDGQIAGGSGHGGRAGVRPQRPGHPGPPGRQPPGSPHPAHRPRSEPPRAIRRCWRPGPARTWPWATPPRLSPTTGRPSRSPPCPTTCWAWANWSSPWATVPGPRRVMNSCAPRTASGKRPATRRTPTRSSSKPTTAIRTGPSPWPNRPFAHARSSPSTTRTPGLCTRQAGIPKPSPRPTRPWPTALAAPSSTTTAPPSTTPSAAPKRRAAT